MARRRKWQNWIGSQRCTADICSPKTLAELRAAVRATATPPAKPEEATRMTGKSYAWDALVPTAGTLVRTDKLHRLLDVDAAQQTLTVESGMTIGELIRHARAHGLTVRSSPIFADISVGGAVSVGAHGTGQRYSTIADDVVELTLITAGGEERTIRRDDPEFAAAGVSLGSMGILYSVKLRCDRAFNVRVETGYLPRAELMAQLDDLLGTYEFVELYWFLS
jgi:L-gulono-1,4-lactone dehydrogenase